LKIAFITGSRGEWGYIRPIIRLIDNGPDLDYQIIVTGMHLLDRFGLSVNEITSDGFTVHEKIYMLYDGYNTETMSKSLGALLSELPGALNRLKPDILVLAGDRGDQLIGAIVAVHLGIPTAHIQGGELSGNVDGVVRHAISKLCDIHFTANETTAARLRAIGESNIHVTGAPQLDELVNGDYTRYYELVQKYDINKGYVLALLHPVTDQEIDAKLQIKTLIDVYYGYTGKIIFIYPNSDAGSEMIRYYLERSQNDNMHFSRNVPRRDYLGLMKYCGYMIGNSSSAILEAPTFATPAVNIGRRQHGRDQGDNVVNCGWSTSEIIFAINEAQNLKPSGRNPYGDGKSAPRIVEILKGM